MAAFAWYVRGTLLVPKQTVAGPELVSHRVDHDEDCVDCHGKVSEWHKEHLQPLAVTTAWIVMVDPRGLRTPQMVHMQSV